MAGRSGAAHQRVLAGRAPAQPDGGLAVSAAARAAGATTLDGLGMLVHQAAAQLALWTGRTPPVEAMWEAAEGAAVPEG